MSEIEKYLHSIMANCQYDGWEVKDDSVDIDSMHENYAEIKNYIKKNTNLQGLFFQGLISYRLPR